MLKSDAVLISGRVPDTLVSRGLWSSKVKSVITTKHSRMHTKRPWTLADVSIAHDSDGGTTNGIFKFCCLVKSPIAIRYNMIPDKEYVQQDLRWILKSKEAGQKSKGPDSVPSSDAARKVNFCGHKIVREDSLFPLASPDVKVVTQFRNTGWVTRQLSTMERMLVMDAPEHLIRCLPDMPDQLWLLQSLSIPTKVLQYVVEQVHVMCNPDPKEETRITSARAPSDIARPMNLNRDVICGGKRFLTVLPTIREEVDEAEVGTPVDTATSNPFGMSASRSLFGGSGTSSSAAPIFGQTATAPTKDIGSAFLDFRPPGSSPMVPFFSFGNISAI